MTTYRKDPCNIYFGKNLYPRVGREDVNVNVEALCTVADRRDYRTVGNGLTRWRPLNGLPLSECLTFLRLPSERTATHLTPDTLHRLVRASSRLEVVPTPSWTHNRASSQTNGSPAISPAQTYGCNPGTVSLVKTKNPRKKRRSTSF